MKTNREQIASKATRYMVGSGLMGASALIGSVVLSFKSLPGYAFTWWLIGGANVVLFAINLHIYRRVTGGSLKSHEP